MKIPTLVFVFSCTFVLCLVYFLFVNPLESVSIHETMEKEDYAFVEEVRSIINSDVDSNVSLKQENLSKFNMDRSVPISIDNPLWKEPWGGDMQQRIKEVERTLLNLKRYTDDIDEYIQVFDNNIDMGVNNLIAALVRFSHTELLLGSKLLHEVGSFVVGKSDNIQYIIEVVSDMAPSNAPLHGAVWQLLANLNSTDKDVLYNFIENEICTMDKSYNGNTTSTYENCIHGVGHGVAMLFQPDYVKGTELCMLYPQLILQYDCAGGVYMGGGIMFEITIEDCKEALYPASCFRVLRNHYKIENPCMGFSGAIRRACIWGEASVIKNVEVCEKYYTMDKNNDYQVKNYLACIQGALAEGKQTNVQKSCDAFKISDSLYKDEIEALCSSNLKNRNRYPQFLLEWFEELR